MSPLDRPLTKLTQFDYEYLKGNKEFWDIKGAAFNCVYEDCKNTGFGSFGDPTEHGKKVMEAYEREHLGSG